MRTLVVAPHPDDEILGPGGTLLKRKSEGAITAWLLVTSINTKQGWSSEKVAARADEIEKINAFMAFDEIFNLGHPPTKLDTLSKGELVQSFSQAFETFKPEEVFLPHAGDIHSDHRIVFDAAVSCTKWFRHPSIKRVYSYETISETDMGLESDKIFRPNVFVDITKFLDSKLKAMEIYKSEIGDFPFPRSRQAIEALARYRGASSGFAAAEAFQLLRERQ